MGTWYHTFAKLNKLPDRLMVGLLFLVQSIQVRVLVG